MTTVPVSVGDIKALYGFSRGTQATLSVAQPTLAAFLAVGEPPWGRLALALVAAFAGYFSVFAVNDLIDVRVDRQRLARLREYEGFDIDSAGVRHPLARGQLRYAVALGWVLVLAGTALTIAAIISWVCAALFLVAAMLEVAYCALARVTPYKFALTGLMVGVGACAGWFAVTTSIDWPLLAVFFVWMAAWEIGGRNIVNDWADVEEDVHLGVKTVPVVFGYRASGLLVLAFVILTFAASAVLMVASLEVFGVIGLAGTMLAGIYGLLWPGVRLLRDPRPPVALTLFNRASVYPVVALVAVVAGLAVHQSYGI